jgi:hypothetical protein
MTETAEVMIHNILTSWGYKLVDNYDTFFESDVAIFSKKTEQGTHRLKIISSFDGDDAL